MLSNIFIMVMLLQGFVYSVYAFNQEHVDKVLAHSQFCKSVSVGRPSDIPANLRDLKNLDLDGVQFQDLKIIHADFSASSMRGVVVKDSMFALCDFDSVDMSVHPDSHEATKFIGSMVANCHAEGAVVANVAVEECTIFGVNIFNLQIVEDEEEEDNTSKLHYYNPYLLCAPSSAIASNKCAICKDRYKKDTIVAALSCRHCFCKTCIEWWIAQNPSCPTCRAEIEEVYNLRDIWQGGFYAARWDQFTTEPLPRLRSQVRSAKPSVRRQPQRACKKVK